MGLLGKATDKVQYELTPVGEYVWTLWDMTSETGQYGEQVKWVWLISPVSAPDSYILRGDGQQEKEVWQFTKPSIAKGSRARIWTETLLGRELKTGEEPDESDLIRRRMIATLVHKAKKSDPTIKNEAISEELPPRRFIATQTSPADPEPVAAQASQAEIDAELAKSDELRKRFKKLVRNASLEELPGYEKWDALVVEDLADGDIRGYEAEIRKAMREAVAA